jgi:hypothetical protein
VGGVAREEEQQAELDASARVEGVYAEVQGHLAKNYLGLARLPGEGHSHFVAGLRSWIKWAVPLVILSR